MARQALLSDQMDLTITQLGLFGFLVPITLGMATRVLPLYLRLRPLSASKLWSAFVCYVAGLALSLLALWMNDSAATGGYLHEIGALLLGSALLAFIAYQGLLLPQRRARLIIPAVQTKRGSLPARPYPAGQGKDCAAFGPFAWLIRCAFGWLALAALLCFTLNLWRLLRGGPRAVPHSPEMSRQTVIKASADSPLPAAPGPQW